MERVPQQSVPLLPWPSVAVGVMEHLCRCYRECFGFLRTQSGVASVQAKGEPSLPVDCRVRWSIGRLSWLGAWLVLLAIASGCTGQLDSAEIVVTTRSSLTVAAESQVRAAGSGTSSHASAPDSEEPDQQLDGDEYMAKMAQCLRDQGWVINLNSEGGISYSFPADQVDQFRSAEQVCLKIYGNGVPVADERFAADLFDRLVVIAKCVRDAGFDVDDPPSKAAFVEKLITHPIPVWHPYYKAAEGGQLSAVERACPVE